ncbi:MAG: hypothetical protein M1829_005303 [Trizodia sp. TS-e1964]|nr:MAG: hypothetical protein M1829_005303 [Trizodia sp. TS-e1964]
MTRRILRTGVQLTALAASAIFLLLFLDNRYRVLPSSIHNYLPVHHPGLLITDITITYCSALSIFSSCNLDPDKWHRIEKDLYLGKGLISTAWVNVQRKKEEELTLDDKYVLEIKISRLNPGSSEKNNGEIWEARPCGLWLRTSTRHHASDLKDAVTAVDVLFGADAVEVRTGWRLGNTPLLLGTSGEVQEARLTYRRGEPGPQSKPKPRMRGDGKFKIIQVSDMHLSTGIGACREPEPSGHNGGKCDADTRTLSFIERLLDDEKPDLAVLSGDQVNGGTAPDAQSAVFKFAQIFIERQIPYAIIFGNHDDEGSLSRSATMSLVEQLPFSLSEAGPPDIDGVGNYIVEVLARGKSSHSALTLYLLDSHSYSPDEKSYKGYDWLKPNQIKWFQNTARSLKKKHHEYTHIHMDMAFIHIPLPEYRNQKNRLVGNWKEPPTAPGFNSEFAKALMEENVLTVSCGHDHVNDYCSLESKPDKSPGLWMCYAGGSGFGGYGGYGGYHRRVRFFDIDMNAARITTYKRLEWGETEKRIDEQVIVQGGIVVA